MKDEAAKQARAATARWGPVGAIAVLLAITLQVLATVGLDGANLRVGASDPVLVAAAAWVLWRGVRGDPLAPAWRVGRLWAWLAVLTAWMAVALINGRLATGEWVPWGVVNRGLGWLVLVAYLWLGGWLAGVGGLGARERFLKAFLLFGWAACAYGLVLYALYAGGVTIPALNAGYERVEGLMANPNAFGFAVACLLSVQAPFLARRALFSAPLAFAGMGLALAALGFSGSRSAWAGLLLAYAGLVWLGALRLSDLAKGAVVALLIGVVLVFVPPLARDVAGRLAAADPLGRSPSRTLADGAAGPAAKPAASSGVVWKTPYFLRQRQLMEHGVRVRWAITQEALTAWREAPLLGVGLGTFYRMRQEDDAEGVTTIHTTALWLLTETGLVGAGLFAACFLVCAGALARAGRGGRDPVAIGVLGVLLAFAGTSLGTDVMYQRHLWFLAGLALAVPAAFPRAGPAADLSAPRSPPG